MGISGQIDLWILAAIESRRARGRGENRSGRCEEACELNADRCAKCLISRVSLGSKLDAEQHLGTDNDVNETARVLADVGQGLVDLFQRENTMLEYIEIDQPGAGERHHFLALADGEPARAAIG